MPERVLVTGPDGLLGGWVARSLLERGSEVVLLRRPGAGARPLPEGAELAEGDLADPGSLESVLRRRPCSTVLHLAAQTQVAAAAEAPVETFAVNVAGTWNLLDACRSADVERVVVASSDKVYGPAEELPCPESAPLAARHPYDVSKACADMIARSYAATYGLGVAVLRLPNVYGARDANRARLVPAVCAALLAGRAPYIRSDGSPRRDLLHASDAAAALLAVPADGEAYNAGSGTTYSVREITDELVAASGTALGAEYATIPTPPGELAAGWLDAGKLTAATGWTPRTPLAEGLAATYAWYAEHPGFLPAAEEPTNA